MSVCVPVSSCVCVCGFLYELVAGGEPAGCCFDERILLKAPPISVYSPADRRIESFAEIWPLFGLYSSCVVPCDPDARRCFVPARLAFNLNAR